MTDFQHHIENISFQIGERDSTRYLRAFDATVGAEANEDRIDQAARSAIAFVCDDAFRRGFATCREGFVEQVREDALEAMRAHGRAVQIAIIKAFEDHPGVPNQLTEDIYRVKISEPVLPPARICRTDLGADS